MNEVKPILLPCPFCGGAPEIVTRNVEPQGDPWYGRKDETFVLCNCGAALFDGAFHEGFYDAQTRAVEAWNRRALSSSPSEDGGEPTGWKLVPVEPTEAMLVAGWNEYLSDMKGGTPRFAITYRAMLAASPPQQGTGDADGVPGTPGGTDGR
jgi:hypothetical protein